MRVLSGFGGKAIMFGWQVIKKKGWLWLIPGISFVMSV